MSNREALYGACILVAEDQTRVQQYICHRLSLLGAHAVGVATVREARRQLKRRTFEAVLLDLCLADGHARALRPMLVRPRPRPQVLVMTGLADQVELRRWTSAGARVMHKLGSNHDELLDALAERVRTRRSTVASAARLVVAPAIEVPLSEPSPLLDVDGSAISPDELLLRFVACSGYRPSMRGEACLSLWARGVSAAAIGQQLDPVLSPQGVHQQLVRLRRKAGADTLQQLASKLRLRVPSVR